MADVKAANAGNIFFLIPAVSAFRVYVDFSPPAIERSALCFVIFVFFLDNKFYKNGSSNILDEILLLRHAKIFIIFNLFNYN